MKWFVCFLKGFIVAVFSDTKTWETTILFPNLSNTIINIRSHTNTHLEYMFK